jgi:adenosylhomocysteinase
MENIIRDPSLASQGEKRMKWYRSQMKVVRSFHERYGRERPFEGMRLLVCMHCEPKAAVRTEALLNAGVREIVFVGNLGSTKDDIAAYLSENERVTVMARSDDTLEDLNRYVAIALKEGPYDLFMDNGASIMLQYDSSTFQPLGGIEETRSGRLLLDEKGIEPAFPLLVIDDSRVKRLIENETGVGQSVVDGFLRQTSMLLGGKRVLIIGYGFCGRGIAQRFRAMGSITSVYDIDNVAMLKAKVEGHIVGRLEDLLPQAEVIITVTGRFHVLGAKHIPYLQDNCIIANAGHYNMEIDIDQLKEKSDSIEILQDGIEQLTVDGKRLNILQRGNPLNLSSGAGNPIEIMELGYALQLLSLEAIVKDKDLKPGIQNLPESVEQDAAKIALDL